MPVTLNSALFGITASKRQSECLHFPKCRLINAEVIARDQCAISGNNVAETPAAFNIVTALWRKLWNDNSLTSRRPVRPLPVQVLRMCLGDTAANRFSRDRIVYAYMRSLRERI